MRKLFLYVILIVSTFFLTNCSKTDTSTPAAAATDYSPLTTGSNWTYKFNNGTSTDTFKLTILNKDTMVNSKTYKVLSSSDGTQNNYMAKVGTDYYRFQSFPTLGIPNFEELYLKDNLDVNGTWTNTTNFTYPAIPVPLTATLNYTIKEKGISHAVNGTTYTNVIHVRVDISVTVVGSIKGGDFYYAKGIGLIESNLAIGGTGIPTYNATETIISSQIK